MNYAQGLFWISVAWIAYVWIGYPLILWVVSRKRQVVPEIADDYCPSVSVLIAARNEQKDIGRKVKQTLAWNYPADRLDVLIGSDASTDETDNVVQSVRDSRVRFVRNDERYGKNRTLNRLAQISSGELLLFTDANTSVEPQCLRKIVRHFSDERVGCVTGLEQELIEGDASTLTIGSNAYLGYESAVDRLESIIGSVLVCDGSLYCLRRSLFTNLDPDLANDLEHPVRVGALGALILYDPEARSVERCTSSAREEFMRRRRIAGQGALAMWRLRRELKGIRLWQFVSRKLLRWLMLIPLVTLFITSYSLRHQYVYGLMYIAQIVFYCMATLGIWKAGRSRIIGMLRLPFVVLLAHVAVFLGFIDACCGRKYAIWNIANMSRGDGSIYE